MPYISEIYTQLRRQELQLEAKEAERRRAKFGAWILAPGGNFWCKKWRLKWAK
jgi:hypothetical protein